MKRKKTNKIYLEDILNAIQHIYEYTEGYDFEKFCGDKKTQDAVTLQIAIIGEALNKLTDEFVEDNPELPVQQAVAMRNVLVHDYDWVDLDEVWRTIQKDLPFLRKQVEEILRN